MDKKIAKDSDYIEQIVHLMKSGLEEGALREKLDNFHEKDIAAALEELNQADRKRLYRALGEERMSEVFSYLEDVGKYLEELQIENAADIIERMDSDDAVDALEEVDEGVRQKLLDLMDTESREDIRLIRSYGEDEIGSRMTTNFIVISRRLTVKQAMRALVAQAEENDNIGTIYVTDDDGAFFGAIDLKDLIVAREHVELDSLISHSYPYVTAHEKIDECIERLKEYAEDSIPVLSDNRHMLGVITAQDIVEAVDEEMGDDYAKLAGLTAEEDLHESLKTSIRKRLPWLVVLLFLGMVVSSVVGVFETVVSRVALIVCFQSLILDMAGNVGTQSLAVTIRVLMDEKLKARQKVGLMLKEMRIGLCNGALLGGMSVLVIGLYIWLLKGKTVYYAFAVSGCVGAALLAAMIISSLVGTVIPMFFHKIKVDPAVASGPLITTVNDLVAVVTYYGLAWVMLIHVLGLA